ncbi:MAG TPA: DUF4886 domain-containing protein [Pirellulales bacterium]|jgi:hypothetical protein|nr:DUF4886 domain-containing protein [Pirellulales bacterium]
MLTKNHHILLLAALSWLGLAACCFAEPPAETAAGEFSIYLVGNSLTGDLISQFPKIATPYEEAQGKTFRWGLHFRGATSLSFMYANPEAPKTSSTKATNTEGHVWKSAGDEGFVPWTRALPENHWDAVTLQPWQDDSKATLQSDTEAVNGMIAAARARPDNASTRFYLYCPWTDTKYDDLDSFRKAFLTPIPDRPDQLAKPTRDYFRHLADAVHKTHPDVAMIPAGEVHVALDEKMQAGKFEHFTSVRDLHRDVIHLNGLGANVAAWTAYAVIFQKSPVGLPAHGLQNGSNQPPFKSVTEISPADLKLMQETVWEVVTSPELRGYTLIP